MPRTISHAFFLLLVAVVAGAFVWGCAAPQQAAPEANNLSPAGPGTPQTAGPSGASPSSQMRDWVQSSLESLGVGSTLPVPQGAQGKGALVSTVRAGSPAERGGIRAGDAIVSFNGKTVTSPMELAGLIAETNPTARYAVVVDRQGEQVSVQVSGVSPSTLSAPTMAGGKGMRPGGRGRGR